MRAQDMSLIAQATDTLDLDICYDLPAVETVEAKRNRPPSRPEGRRPTRTSTARCASTTASAPS